MSYNDFTTRDDYAGIDTHVDDALDAGLRYCDLCGELRDPAIRDLSGTGPIVPDIAHIEYDGEREGWGWVCRDCQAEKLEPCPFGCGLNVIGKPCSNAGAHETAPPLDDFAVLLIGICRERRPELRAALGYPAAGGAA